MTWKEVPLGTLLTREKTPVAVEATETYKQITVRLHHKGAVLRQEVTGDKVGSNQYLARQGQFILSGIDARHGAFALVPESLDGAIVTNDFWVFNIDRDRLLPEFLDHFSGTRRFRDACVRASEGSTNRVRLKAERFARIPLPLPPLDEQRRVVARIDDLMGKVRAARALDLDVTRQTRRLLLAAYARSVKGSPVCRLDAVAPLVRRPFTPEPASEYVEIGVRSFGNGTFQKGPFTGATIGDKRVFTVHEGDVVFSNVFAWEGGIAVAQATDHGIIGSHRFMTCVPDPVKALPEFVCFHFLTPRGLSDVQAASPGGAGRNRTLSQKGLAKLPLPLPSLDLQKEFVALLHRQGQIGRIREVRNRRLGVLPTSIINTAFSGRL